MKLNKKFKSDDQLVDLIKRDYNILSILSRFSIPLGFGNKTIGQVCRQASIETDVFLLVVNFLISGKIDDAAMARVPVTGIVDFLQNSHDFFMGYKFGHIRRNLLEALDDYHSDINPSIVKFYDDFINQVKIHFNYEETKVFPYIRRLDTGAKSRYSIEIFRRHHEEVVFKLTELKNIILRYYPTAIPNKMYDVLIDIYNCEEDLESHSRIENDILIPMVERIERQKNTVR